jgi:hypothetical protein
MELPHPPLLQEDVPERLRGFRGSDEGEADRRPIGSGHRPALELPSGPVQIRYRPGHQPLVAGEKLRLHVDDDHLRPRHAPRMGRPLSRPSGLSQSDPASGQAEDRLPGQARLLLPLHRAFFRGHEQRGRGPLRHLSGALALRQEPPFLRMAHPLPPHKRVRGLLFRLFRLRFPPLHSDGRASGQGLPSDFACRARRPRGGLHFLIAGLSPRTENPRQILSVPGEIQGGGRSPPRPFSPLLVRRAL